MKSEEEKNKIGLGGRVRRFVWLRLEREIQEEKFGDLSESALYSYIYIYIKLGLG